LLLTIIILIISIMATSPADAEFQDLGIPVRKAGLMGILPGPDNKGEITKLYFSFYQDKGTLFLLQIDPLTDETKQFEAPVGAGAYAFIIGPDNKIYLGTWEGGHILRFDPKQEDKGIEVLGKPSKTDSYIWMFTIGKDGKLYGGTSGNAGLISYDPEKNEMQDLGRMDPTEQYNRKVATGENGWIYCGIGLVRASIVAYNPLTGRHQLAIPEHIINQTVSGTFGAVWNGVDGRAYGRLDYGSSDRVDSHYYLLKDGKAKEIREKDAVLNAPKTLNGHVWRYLRNELADQLIETRMLKDGYILSDASEDGWYTLYHPETKSTLRKTFQYTSGGLRIFTLGQSADGIIYGGTALPLQFFWYNPKTGVTDNPGNPTSVNGQIHSFASLNDKLYIGAYPHAWLSIYDIDKQWNYGTMPENNPYGFGPIGDGHMRPQAMIAGRDGRLYIGSIPSYGQFGGALGVYDPKKEAVVENYRHLIPNQSIVALTQEPVSGFIFGLSYVIGGGGTNPIEKDAHLFAWDPIKQKKVLDIAPFPGRGRTYSITNADRKIFAIFGDPWVLLVYDTVKREIVHRAEINKSFGRPLVNSLGQHTDGLIYGLADYVIFTINPKTYEVREFARTGPRPNRVLTCGWAINDTGIYFGSDAHLMRWKW